jgi:protein gp37
MGETTGIQWADATVNFWMGCHRVSPACAHCYADREMTRYGRDFSAVSKASDATFYRALHWKDSKRIFTCSWSDFFIKEADPWRREAWQVITHTPWHTWMILTKRIERAEPRDMPANVWLGVSVENARFYERIRMLKNINVGVRFLSIEPLLGPMPDLPLEGIGWVIVGGESGPNWRPLQMNWVRQIRDRCVERKIPFFFKQQSGYFPKALDRLVDGREWNQFPIL